MNGITIYKKDTDSSLTLSPEELNGQRNLYIPKAGDFLITNSTNLKKDIKSSYSVGPNGDFQNLEDAVRILCNARMYSSNEPLLSVVEIMLEDDYEFKPYFQSGLDAHFIIIKSRTPINITANKLKLGVFTFINNATGPKFADITFNITSIDSRVFDIEVNSYASFERCNFVIDHRDDSKIQSSMLILNTLNSTFRLINSTIKLDINKTNQELLNSGNKFRRTLINISAGSNSFINVVNCTVVDHSNKHTDSYTRVFDCNVNSVLTFEGNGATINFKTKKGTFDVFSSNHGSYINIPDFTVVTANSEDTAKSVMGGILLAYEQGDINAMGLTIKDSGSSSRKIRNIAQVSSLSRVDIRGYKNVNSQINQESNLVKDTFSKEGIVSI